MCIRDSPYRVYGPFLRNWRGQVLAKQPSTVAAPTGLVDLDPAQLPAGESLEALRESHGFKGAEICPCRPGEVAAFEQLTRFCEGRCSAMSRTAISPVPQAPPPSVLP